MTKLLHPIAALAIALTIGPLAAQAQQADDPQILEHGPLHEAFADPLKFDTQESLVVEKAPPEPVDELPPDMKPEGANVHWIPGYWMWDHTRDDFIWVSGVYRNMPPGRTWVVGYWSESPQGYVWTPGFWTNASEQTVNYLPEPPASLEEGPSSPAPGEDYFWVPGCWQYQSQRYVWQAGYWYQGRQNWVWVPNHYCNTPRGVVYVNGYWDYPLANRGLLYAPVYWGNGYYPTRNYRYRPSAVIAASRLLTALFISPRYGYYYGPSYAYRNNSSFYPWYTAYNGYYSGRRGYDPLLAYYAWNTGHNRNGWQNQLRNDYDRAWDGRDQRNHRDDNRRHRDGDFDHLGGLVQNVDRINQQDFGASRLTRQGEQDLNRFRRDADRYKQLADQRAENESRSRGNRGPRGDADTANRGDLARHGEPDARRNPDQGGGAGLEIPQWAREQGSRSGDSRRGQGDGNRQREFAQSNGQDRRQRNEATQPPTREFRGFRGGSPNQTPQNEQQPQAAEQNRQQQLQREANRSRNDSSRNDPLRSQQRNQADQRRRAAEQQLRARQATPSNDLRRSLPQTPGGSANQPELRRQSVPRQLDQGRLSTPRPQFDRGNRSPGSLPPINRSQQPSASQSIRRQATPSQAASPRSLPTSPRSIQSSPPRGNRGTPGPSINRGNSVERGNSGGSQRRIGSGGNSRNRNRGKD